MTRPDWFVVLWVGLVIIGPSLLAWFVRRRHGRSTDWSFLRNPHAMLLGGAFTAFALLTSASSWLAFAEAIPSAVIVGLLIAAIANSNGLRRQGRNK